MELVTSLISNLVVNDWVVSSAFSSCARWSFVVGCHPSFTNVCRAWMGIRTHDTTSVLPFHFFILQLHGIACSFFGPRVWVHISVNHIAVLMLTPTALPIIICCGPSVAVVALSSREHCFSISGSWSCWPWVLLHSLRRRQFFTPSFSTSFGTVMSACLLLGVPQTCFAPFVTLFAAAVNKTHTAVAIVTFISLLSPLEMPLRGCCGGGLVRQRSVSFSRCCHGTPAAVSSTSLACCSWLFWPISGFCSGA